MGWTGLNWTANFVRFVVDLTGDGRADIVGCGQTGTWISRNDGHGNFAPPEIAFNDFGFNQDWRKDRHIRAVGYFTSESLIGGIDLSTVAVAVAHTVPGAEPAAVAATAGASNHAGANLHLNPARFRRNLPGLIGFGDHATLVAAGSGAGGFHPVTGAVANFSIEQGWTVAQHPRLVADLDGNGMSDIVGFGNDGVWTALCKGGSAAAFGEARFALANFGFNQGWRGDTHPRLVGDLTGDRRGDIVGFGNDGVWTSIGKGDGTFAEPRLALGDLGFNQGWRVASHPRFLADLNGDGRMDVIGFGNDGVWTSIGSGDGGLGGVQFGLANFGFNQGWRVDMHPRFVLDLTGDGRADIIGFGNDGVWTSLGRGDGTFEEPRFVLGDLGFNHGWRTDLHPRFLPDINGDGRPDIVGFGNDGVWTALNNGDGTFGPAQFVLADFGARSGQTAIKHVFVCMLENRSYDHFLGFADISGTDAQTGAPTRAEGLTGQEKQEFDGVDFPVSADASDRVVKAPPHNFNDFMVALCGAGHVGFNPGGGPYPQVVGTGYAAANGFENGTDAAGEIMKCFSPDTLPILTQLAQEFVVCDKWFAPMPGPTEPNRMFVHAAECDTWDDSPSEWDQVEAELWGDDIKFTNGTIFDRLRKANVDFRIYAGDDFPNVALLHGISLYTDIDDYDDFSEDLHDGYDVAYTFIEPNYDVVLDSTFSEGFYEGNSQHPRGSVAAGEQFIKSVYETIRNSPVWESSLLVVTWDEGGGFFDHVLPPRAAPTGKLGKTHGFVFDQLGTRVPAVVVSPLIPRNLIEHRVLEHSVIPATVEQLFGLPSLTVRDGAMVGLQALATLKTPRSDTPTHLVNAVTAARTAHDAATQPSSAVDSAVPVAQIKDENFIPVLQSAAIQHMRALPDQKDQIRARIAGIHTLDDLRQYMREVSAIVKRKRAENRAARRARRNVVIRDHRHPVVA